MADTPDQKMVAEWEKKFSAIASARQKFEREWFMNLSFYFSKQYAQWASNANSLGMALIVPKAPAWRARLVANRIKPAIRKETAKIAKSRPHFYVIPSTTEDADISKARVAEGIAEFLLLNNEFDKKKRSAIWWAALTGVGYIKTTVEGNEQDVVYEAPTTFHVWVPNLEVEDIQDQPYIVHGLNLTPDEVEMMYGVEVQADSKSTTPDSKYFQSIGIDRSRESDVVFVKEFWVKSCKEFPDGAMFVTANNKLLYKHSPAPEYELDPATNELIKDEAGEFIVKEPELGSNVLGGESPKSSFPYSHGMFPIEKVGHIPTGRFYNESVITDLIPLQKNYNRNRSQVVEHRNMTVNPQWGVARGSVDVRKITNEPGLHIEFLPGFNEPKPIASPPLGDSVIVDAQATLADFDFITNQFEISQGRTPPNVEAASAIAFLQEESDSVLSYTIASLEEAVEAIGYQSLELVREFWPVGKTVKIVSGADLYEVITFKNDTLPEQIDFRIERDSMAPKSKAAQQAFIMELMANGYIPPMEGMKYLEMSTTNRLYEDLMVDQQQARREGFRMQQGDPVPVNPWDNHVAHVMTHERFMKSQEFEMLDEEAQTIYIQHWQAHMVALGKEELDNVVAGSDPDRPDSNATE